MTQLLQDDDTSVVKRVAPRDRLREARLAIVDESDVDLRHQERTSDGVARRSHTSVRPDA